LPFCPFRGGDFQVQQKGGIPALTVARQRLVFTALSRHFLHEIGKRMSNTFSGQGNSFYVVALIA
jgi:hypothetical protein